MKKIHWMFALLMAGALPALAAPQSCEQVKDKIQQKIIKNGVSESAFTLDVVPNDQSDRKGAKIVGNCGKNTFKIVYTRNTPTQQ